MTDNINATNPDNVERITFIEGSLGRFLREYPELHKELRDGLAEAFRKTKKQHESAEEIYLKAYDVAAHAATFGTNEELTVARHNSMTAHEECGIAEEGHQEAREALGEVQATLALEAQSYKNDETRCKKRLKEIQDTLEKAIGEPVKVLKQSRANVEILRLADIDLCLQSLKTIADPFMLAQECYNLQWHVKRTLMPSLEIVHPGEGREVKPDPERSAVIWID
ncbi:hypothetical protein NLU13_1407 [Sarocladium strictum]|uniref:Uncharacterized protein n=1 Tax=Sarocladium strictum TaxID=5046 RepID=A0AA39LCG6_SARSR|nr:hypothetical protein NLU13_1407 [Sarocladium strictum]